MSMTIRFSVAGIPKAQPRVKAFRRGNHAGVYDPGTADGWKLLVREEARKACKNARFDGPVELNLWFAMPRPKGHYNKKGLKANAPIYHIAKPDLDNLAKAVMDALTNLSVWRDDSQVVTLSIRKHYSETPGVDVEIRHLQEHTAEASNTGKTP